MKSYVSSSIKRGLTPRQPALTGQRWFKDAAIGNNTVVSGTSRDVGEGFFTFSPNNGRTGVHPCVRWSGNYLPSGGGRPAL